MPDAQPHAFDPVDTPGLATDLARRLNDARVRAATDPFTNAPLLFALDLSREIGRGDVTLDALDAVITRLTAQAFTARAERLAAYLGDCSPEHQRMRLDTLFEAIAARGDFDAYARAVEAAPFGFVLTAHPTFALNHDLSIALIELASGRTAEGGLLTDDGRVERLALAVSHVHGPPAELTLDVEHAWSMEALDSTHAALETVYGVALEVARRRWPTRWAQLTPRLMTLATWVGFDQDGRTDVTWQVSVGKRLQLKITALQHRRATLNDMLDGAAGDWRLALDSAADLLDRALQITTGQLVALDAAKDDPDALSAFGRAMVQGRRHALVEPAPLLRRLEDALETAPDDHSRAKLLILRAGVSAEGVSLAGVHVRLNSGQLHNAIRRDVGLQGSPTDPANRRTYFSAIDALIAKAKPAEINFGDLAHEPASARRLMMTVAQMRKYVDASTPVRFLIAETETGFTLLTALYFARLFGVEDHVEISPLFETEEAFERGEKVVEEALRSRHFRDYLVRHGRLAIEFGFSDSGRFIGQLAATFRIERLRFRLAEMMRQHDLTGLVIVFFNTHGESVGRGGHPGSLSDRFRYAAPPRSRAEFARTGIRVKEEDSFQGGEGYLPLMIPAAALATVVTALETVLLEDDEAGPDPIYDDPDFATEFFTTCEQDFSSLAADPNYAALVGLFATHLLPKTGSRPVQRQVGEGGRPHSLASVSELRAIPNNGVLQQLGYLANSFYGLGRAAEKDRDTFEGMRRRSPRFRRALALAETAAAASDLTVLQAYVGSLQSYMWLARATAVDAPACDLALAEVVERIETGEHLRLIDNLLKAEDVRMRVADVRTRQGDRLQLLHATRIALIQASYRLVIQVPDFNPRGEITLAVIQERLMRLDVASSLELLRGYFPQRGESPSNADFGEPSSYAATGAQGYLRETDEIFDPLERLFGLMLKISYAVSHEAGACG